jgi:hypothetical protein
MPLLFPLEEEKKDRRKGKKKEIYLVSKAGVRNISEWAVLDVAKYFVFPDR